MRPKDDREVFERIVGQLLSENLHVRRGLTVSDYRALCRKAWEECKISPGFERKILIDPLSSVSRMFENLSEEYVHWRMQDYVELGRTDSKAIYCVAVGAVRPDFEPATGDSDSLADIEPDEPETRRYLLAVFDVLGFSAWLEREGLESVTAVYERLVSETVTKDSIRSYSVVGHSSTRIGTGFGKIPIGHGHFSDTVVLWVPLVQHFIAPFIARCADLVCEALQIGVPLRGALAVGRAVLHARSSTFVGSPIVEAAKLEQAQDWMGVCIGPSMLAADVSREFDPTLILRYDVPFKKKRVPVASGLALDWPRRFTSRYGKAPSEALEAFDASPAHHKYYANAIKFAEFSSKAVVRTEGFDGINLDALIGGIVHCRKSGKRFSSQDEFTLRDLARAGPDGATAAEFLRAAAEGKDLPPIPSKLPGGLKRQLRLLRDAMECEGDAFQPTPALVDIAHARLIGDNIQPRTVALLDKLAVFKGDGPPASKFLRELADGNEPPVPRGVRPGLRAMLSETKRWIERREVPSGILNWVANDCCRAASEREYLLSDATLHALAAIKRTGGAWADIANFLYALAEGSNPLVPGTVKKRLREYLERVRIASKPAGVQQPRTADIFAIGIGDPPTDLNLLALSDVLITLHEQGRGLPGQIAEAIDGFEAAAPQRRAVAESLRAIATGAAMPPVPQPDMLPRAVHVALLQVQALASRKTVPIAPELLGLAAIHARFSSRKLGDCSLLSLMLLGKSRGEGGIVAEYLWNVARGEAAGPAPKVADPELACVVEEVRTLAMPEVGGIRMLFTKVGSVSEAGAQMNMS